MELQMSHLKLYREIH